MKPDKEDSENAPESNNLIGE